MKRYAVLGLGRFGSTLARHLAADGADVIVVDSRRDLVEGIADQVSAAVILDATDERALRAHGIHAVDCVIVAIGEHFEANVLATLNCKNLEIPFVVTRGSTAAQCKILEQIGADLVIQPEEESAHRLARQLAVPAVVSIQELAEGLTAVQIETPEHFSGRTLSELDLRNRYGVTLVALRRPEKGNKAVKKLVFPRYDTRLEAGDLLILVGGDEDVTLFTKNADEK